MKSISTLDSDKLASGQDEWVLVLSVVYNCVGKQVKSNWLLLLHLRCDLFLLAPEQSFCIKH